MAATEDQDTAQTPAQWIDAPEAGSLDAVSVPQLLAQAWRDERTGVLDLTHGQRTRRIRVRKGAPLGVEADADDAFATFLSDTGRISAPDRLKIEQVASDRGCPQASAAFALKLLDAKALYAALRAETRAGMLPLDEEAMPLYVAPRKCCLSTPVEEATRRGTS